MQQHFNPVVSTRYSLDCFLIFKIYTVFVFTIYTNAFSYKSTLYDVTIGSMMYSHLEHKHNILRVLQWIIHQYTLLVVVVARVLQVMELSLHLMIFFQGNVNTFSLLQHIFIFIWIICLVLLHYLNQIVTVCIIAWKGIFWRSI